MYIYLLTDNALLVEYEPYFIIAFIFQIWKLYLPHNLFLN